MLIIHFKVILKKKIYTNKIKIHINKLKSQINKNL